MQDLKELALIIAERKKMTLAEATAKVAELIKGKKPFGAKLAISAYLDTHKSSNTIPGNEEIDPINHHKE